jgi:2-methylcitrate dehydratase PrpD
VTALRELAAWAHALRLEDVPPFVRARAVDQLLSTLGAMYAGSTNELGPKIERLFATHALGPTRDAMRMASWSMVLDYDDVMLGGHTGHSAVLVPLAFADGHSGAELLLAQIVANEIAARVNMVCAVGSTRGQMATHLHLLAAAAARAKLEGLDAATFADALSFALSYPAQALYPAFLGSDAKALCAALPIRAGIEAVDAVRAGLRAADDVLDGPRGFFATHARVPVRDFLGGLGTRWHTATNSFKIYPVCGYLCSALDATLELVRAYDVHAEDVASVDVNASLFVVGMDAHSAPYLDGPRSSIAALTFSTPFVIASAILARAFTPSQLERAWIEDRRVWQLAARVRSRHDPRLTREALTADIPIGAALRRVKPLQAAGFAWSIAATAFGSAGRLRRPLETLRLIAELTAAAGERGAMEFERATKPLGARVAIRLRDGRTLEREVTIPRGFAGGIDDVRSLMIHKFLAAAAPIIGSARAATAAVALEHFESLAADAIARLTAILTPVAQTGAPLAHVRSGR